MNAIKRFSAWEQRQFEKVLDALIAFFRWLGVMDEALDLSGADKIDPDHITVEATAEAINVSKKAAKRICETAVRQGYFRKVDDYYILEQNVKIS